MTVLSRLLMACTLIAITVCLSGKANAHFVWIYSDGGNVKVVFGEGLEPDQAKFLNGLSGMKAFTVINGQRQSVEFKKQVDGDEGWFESPMSKLGQQVEIACPYGVFGRGDSTMFLDYSAKYVSISSASASQSSAKPSPKLALDIVPSFVDGKLNLTAYFKGQPVKGVEIQLEDVQTDTDYQTTNESGQVTLAPASRHVIRAKHTVDENGEYDGKAFSERRYYCTLVLDLNRANTATSVNSTSPSQQVMSQTDNIKLEQVETQFEDLPRGMTSFGAAVVDQKIYVIGGKSGKAHDYAKSYQNRNVYCLNIDGSDPSWEIAGDNLGLQGLAIVGHEGKVFRIGGLEARNKEGEDHDLHSSDSFLAFDTVKKTWSELPNLPAPRSSFDACVANGKLYVVGGWTMTGEDETVWATDVLTFDLTQPGAKWQHLEAPFRTRALAARVHGNKLIAIGGIREAGGPTNQVHLFDLNTSQWSEGPEVPAEGGIKAFGCSAVSLGKNFLVSTYDGGIYRLSHDLQQWSKVHQLDTGRFFHQMLPINETSFALIGGAHMEYGSQNQVEVFKVSPMETSDNP